MSNMNNNDVRRIYERIRSADTITEEVENLPPSADKLSKQQLIDKIMVMTKFPKDFLRKMDEDNLRTIYNSFMAAGKARVVKALKGESDAEA